MKNILTLCLASMIMTSCYKESRNPKLSSSSSSSHECGYPTKTGPCKRKVSDPGYCWQHR